MDLEAGRLDAVVVDEVVGRFHVAKKADTYTVLEDNFGTEDYGVGFRKDDTELLGKVDQALKDMKADGAAAEISKKWFGGKHCQVSFALDHTPAWPALATPVFFVGMGFPCTGAPSVCLRHPLSGRAKGLFMDYVISLWGHCRKAR